MGKIHFEKIHFGKIHLGKYTLEKYTSEKYIQFGNPPDTSQTKTTANIQKQLNATKSHEGAYPCPKTSLFITKCN